MAFEDEQTLILYASDDGHVRFVESEKPSLYLIEPVMPTGIHLTYTERRYTLSRIRFESVADCNRARNWIGDDLMKLKWVWEKGKGSDGIKLRYP